MLPERVRTRIVGSFGKSRGSRRGAGDLIGYQGFPSSEREIESKIDAQNLQL